MFDGDNFSDLIEMLKVENWLQSLANSQFSFFIPQSASNRA